MRKFFLITAILLSATTAHAGLDATVADADTRAPEAIQSSSAQHPDASELAAKREAMIQQKMAMQKQMMMRKQMAMERDDDAEVIALQSLRSTRAIIGIGFVARASTGATAIEARRNPRPLRHLM